MSNIISLDSEFNQIWTRVKNHENITILRYGDGERSVMTGKSVTAQEGWQSPNFITSLGTELLNTLQLENDNVYYAISCPCCDRESYYWYSTRIQNKNKTFANIFVNANYQIFISEFEKLRRDAIFIGNYRASNKPIGNLNILKRYFISDDCFSFWDNKAAAMLEQIKQDFGHRNDLLYVVSAGPASEALIFELYNNNPNNSYIDFGSAIDKYIHDEQTRPYMDPMTPYAKQVCWMHDPQTTDFNVSVILNLYKRPKNLFLQLESLNSQTLKPKEIILFQDATTDNKKVAIPESLIAQFNKIEISPTNVGVWGRFKFAQNHADNELVCVFDDDTIPGSRWLENCHFEINKQEGLYGTIGIVMELPRNYPFKDYYRVGWDSPIDKSIEVDFVGHSWFFKKSWLTDLFQAPKEIQDLKFVGEDIAFSYMLSKQNIRTFVPPHPLGELDLYGSNPALAVKLGCGDEALSFNAKNIMNMQLAISIVCDDWKTLAARCNWYVIYLKNVCKMHPTNHVRILKNSLL